MQLQSRLTAGALLLLGTYQGAQAAIVSATPQGFEVHETVHVAAAADKAYAALLTPARWWSSDHTFSHDAKNLTLDARAGGCWCETLPDGGSVQHLSVVWVAPGKVLRLRGALGPLQGMAVDGVLTWTVKAAASGSEIAVSYAVAGYSEQGFDVISKGVDQVMAEQIGRLKKLLES
jgi:Polyketide cyclase / dehydrase and lipid transport